MKTVRELTVAGPCITLGDVAKLLRASAIAIATARRNSSANIGGGAYRALSISLMIIRG